MPGRGRALSCCRLEEAAMQDIDPAAQPTLRFRRDVARCVGAPVAR
ncbi:MAG: hypothetical protein HY060_05065 [Proteobacteria bacterium]|nr:hypothetical protein [Pseudomonadota bacterium]